MGDAVTGPHKQEVLDRHRSLQSASGNLLDIHRPIPYVARRGHGVVRSGRESRLSNRTGKDGIHPFLSKAGLTKRPPSGAFT